MKDTITTFLVSTLLTVLVCSVPVGGETPNPGKLIPAPSFIGSGKLVPAQAFIDAAKDVGIGGTLSRIQQRYPGVKCYLAKEPSLYCGYCESHLSNASMDAYFYLYQLPANTECRALKVKLWVKYGNPVVPFESEFQSQLGPSKPFSWQETCVGQVHGQRWPLRDGESLIRIEDTLKNPTDEIISIEEIWVVRDEVLQHASELDKAELGDGCPD